MAQDSSRDRRRHASARRQVRAGRQPHRGRVRGPAHADQGSGPVHGVLRHDRGRRDARGLQRRGRGQDRQRADQLRAARRPPEERRLLRGRRVPGDDVPQHGDPSHGRQRLRAGRRPHDQDITKPITLDGEFLGWGKDPYENTFFSAEAKTTVEREDWDLTWNMAVETGGFLVSKKIDLVIDVEAKKVG